MQKVDFRFDLIIFNSYLDRGCFSISASLARHTHSVSGQDGEDGGDGGDAPLGSCAR